MTDMVAGKDISGAGRKIPKVDNLRPANQGEDPANQPTGELRETGVVRHA